MGLSLADSDSGRSSRRVRRGALSNISTYKVAVYNALLEEIKTLQLQPGERLVEELLSVRFGIS